MKKRVKLFIVALLACTMFTACSQSKGNSDAVSVKQESTEEKSQEESKGDVNQAEQTEEAQKDIRVVAGTVSAMQYLNALGADVVGIPTTEKEIPEAYKGKPEIGLPMTPSQELVLSCEPDIFVSDMTMKSNLEEMFYGQDMELILLDNNTYDSISDNLTILANKLNLEDKLTELIADMNQKKEDAIEFTEGKENPTVAVIFGTTAMFMLATDNSFAGSLVDMLGATNITDGLGLSDAYVTFDREKIAELDPDIILLLSHADPKETKKAFDKEFENAFWQEITAVKENRVYDLDSNYFGVTANYNSVDAPMLLAQILYGE